MSRVLQAQVSAGYAWQSTGGQVLGERPMTSQLSDADAASIWATKFHKRPAKPRHEDVVAAPPVTDGGIGDGCGAEPAPPCRRGEQALPSATRVPEVGLACARGDGVVELGDQPASLPARAPGAHEADPVATEDAAEQRHIMHLIKMQVRSQRAGAPKSQPGDGHGGVHGTSSRGTAGKQQSILSLLGKK
jgi:hypothetical protein